MTTGNDILTAEHDVKSTRFSYLMPPREEASVLTVACRPENFCASELARAVEDSDAHLINMNVTERRLDDGRITVELRTNRRNCDLTARSLERYGYEVISVDCGSDGESDFLNSTLQLHVDELLHLLNL